MSFCSKCGNETRVDLMFCPKCNASQVDYKYKIIAIKDEKAPWVWLIPSFIIPLFGFVAFICLGYDRPKSAFYTMIGTVLGCVAMFTYCAIVVISTYGVF